MMITLSEIMTIVALLTSLGSLWHLKKEISKPRDDIRDLAAQNARTLAERERRISKLEKRTNAALQAGLGALWHLDQNEETDALIQSIEKELMDD